MNNMLKPAMEHVLVAVVMTPADWSVWVFFSMEGTWRTLDTVISVLLIKLRHYGQLAHNPILEFICISVNVKKRLLYTHKDA